MNERIEKLANVWANLRAKDDRLGITYTFSEKALEQFAELIVRECVSVVDKTNPPGYNDYPDYRDQIEKSFRRECATEIKKHFGVEE
jgi:hypothetical protein